MPDINEVPDSILVKIKHLLEGVHGRSQEEIETAHSLARQMLMKYNVDISMLENVSTDKKKKVTEAKVTLNGRQTRHEGGWVENLVSVLARYNLCKAILTGGNEFQYDQGSFYLIGEPHNIELAGYMLDVAIRQIRDLGSILWRKYDRMEKRNTWYRGFFRGCVHGLRMRLASDENAGKTLPSSQQMGIMVRDNNIRIQEYVLTRFGKLDSMKSKNLKGTEGYTTGVITGRGMNIGKGMGGSGSGPKLLN